MELRDFIMDAALVKSLAFTNFSQGSKALNALSPGPRRGMLIYISIPMLHTISFVSTVFVFHFGPSKHEI
jgi:hypothetical protein